VQTTTGLSGPEALASSFAKSAGVTESLPHGHPDEAAPVEPPAHAADSATNMIAAASTASPDRRAIAG
jgi:hypothetical protein